MSRFSLILIFFPLYLGPSISGQEPPQRPAVGISTPAGFRIDMVADDRLATNIYSIVFSPSGKLLVSGPGYIKRLDDTDGDGRFDVAETVYTELRSGAQGLCFDKDTLLCVGGGGLQRLTDSDNDGKYDRSEFLLRCKTGGEHDVHAIRQGPDGWWYLIGGNNSGLGQGISPSAGSPVIAPRAGALVRFSPDFEEHQIVTHGFRNPYDFDFGPAGDIFVYDSDGERDVSLPWYRQTRVFHAMAGTHAGWISRSWKQPGSYLDNAPVVARLGRGSPTGVVTYRHHVFPSEYHGAVFVADWTFGRVIAIVPQQSGSSWTGRQTLFLSPQDEMGFAPTDLAVGPDGYLYVSVGGRGTGGGVFRIRPQSVTSSGAPSKNSLSICLNADQPWDAWSRAKWVPIAKSLGPEPFRAAALNRELPTSQRTRAIEILVHLQWKLPTSFCESLKRDPDVMIRRQLAWSLRTANQPIALLAKLMLDPDLIVARMALESASSRSDRATPAVAKSLGHLFDAPDARIRFLASQIASRTPELDKLVLKHAATTPLGEMTRHFSATLEKSADAKKAIPLAIAISIQSAHPVDVRLQALRLLQLLHGDMRGGQKPPVFDGYAGVPNSDVTALATKHHLQQQLLKSFPTDNTEVNREILRTLAVYGAPQQPLTPQSASKLVRALQVETDPVTDIHLLITLARLGLPREGSDLELVVESLLSIPTELNRLGANRDSNWIPRMLELIDRLYANAPSLPKSLIDHPQFGDREHVIFIESLPKDEFQQGLDQLVKANSEIEFRDWPSSLIPLLGRSQDPGHRNLLRQISAEPLLAEAAIVALTNRPDRLDTSRYIRGLDSLQANVATASVRAIETLQAPVSAELVEALLKAALRADRERGLHKLRDRFVKQLKRLVDFQSGYVADKNKSQRPELLRWKTHLQQRFPGTFVEDNKRKNNIAAFERQLAMTEWDQGDPARGKRQYEQLQCGRCHDGGRASGPSLNGVTRRFSREDLFLAIARPSRDVPARYRTTMIETHDGKIYLGVIIYEAVDGLILSDGMDKTIRIDSPKIAQRQVLSRSLMPESLLDRCSPSDLADLYAYLRSL